MVNDSWTSQPARLPWTRITWWVLLLHKQFSGIGFKVKARPRLNQAKWERSMLLNVHFLSVCFSWMGRGPLILINFLLSQNIYIHMYIYIYIYIYIWLLNNYSYQTKDNKWVLFQLFGSASKIMNRLLLLIGTPLFILLILMFQLYSLSW